MFTVLSSATSSLQIERLCIKWASQEPQIDSYNCEDYNKITFTPDLPRFKIIKLVDDIISVMKKRVSLILPVL